ncbi:GNAT family N-acyltransferase [Yoonia sp. SS1-5]|uniref:L-ornithine N(alpha)-acyltransferase n=1 Tax=Yoonia rhodophyticola TaxID=3137370 RepID=A0AAN0MBK4_9RHOB
MNTLPPDFAVSVGMSEADITAAQRLRYDVFVAELGADGEMVDHDRRLERDRFDPHATHFLLRDKRRPADDQVVGVYRVMSAAAAEKAGQYYCADEYDLSLLENSGQKLLELGRSCLHADYRGGPAMMYLWAALDRYIHAHHIALLFGVASFPGTDLDRLAAPLSLLHHKHLAPPDLRVTARGAGAVDMDMLPPSQIDTVAAMRATPALIKAYLRLGGKVGQGAFTDHAFNTTDICLILPTNAINALQRSIYTRGQPDG